MKNGKYMSKYLLHDTDKRYRSSIAGWVMVSGGLVRKADNWMQVKEIWDSQAHERSVLLFK